MSTVVLGPFATLNFAHGRRVIKIEMARAIFAGDRCATPVEQSDRRPRPIIHSLQPQQGKSIHASTARMETTSRSFSSCSNMPTCFSTNVPLAGRNGLGLDYEKHQGDQSGIGLCHCAVSVRGGRNIEKKDQGLLIGPDPMRSACSLFEIARRQAVARSPCHRCPRQDHSALFAVNAKARRHVSQGRKTGEGANFPVADVRAFTLVQHGSKILLGRDLHSGQLASLPTRRFNENGKTLKSGPRNGYIGLVPY